MSTAHPPSVGLSAGRVGAMAAMAHAVRDALHRGLPLEDPTFDQLYPDHIRRLSRVHWTPVSVALRAAALLAPEAGMAMLDVGAGPGKLCCLGALACGGTWHGIELEHALVAASIAAAEGLEIEHCTSFASGDMTQLDWDRFDSLYFYNPFESLLFSRGVADRAGWTRFADQVARTEERLSRLSAGTRVVTFHGFGGEMPSSFALAFTETIGDGELALWIQQPRSRR